MALPLQVSSQTLRDLLGGSFCGAVSEQIWARLASPETAGPDDVVVVHKGLSVVQAQHCRAGLGIVDEQSAHLGDFPKLCVPNSQVALWQLLTGVCRPTYVAQDWLPSDQVVARFGPLARTSSIHAHAQVGEGTQIGGAVVIHAGVRIGQGCTIGSGVVLGDHGFGIVKLPQSAQILPHWAGLEIEDQVWIGPQTHVAAGLLEPTRIGAGCFLDAQIQIGHNCQLGKGCVLAAQVGISGSVHLGDFCEVGGQAGFADHVRLGERCRVAARAGVTRSWPAGSVLGGFPAEPIAQWRKRMVRERTPKEQGKFPI